MKERDKCFMKKKLCVGGVFAFVFVIIIGGLLFWAHRNPQVSMRLNDKLQPMQMIITATYVRLPVPSDIREGLEEWQDTLAEQYAAYSKVYSDFDVEYRTEIKDTTTIITLEGEGTSKESGQVETISDTITLDFKLYQEKK